METGWVETTKPLTMHVEQAAFDTQTQFLHSWDMKYLHRNLLKPPLYELIFGE